ncbi:MAG: hypothetical protein WCH34_19120, partial [Bacteroidota bacterium]
NSFFIMNFALIPNLKKPNLPRTKSQLLVCGATMMTHFLISGGKPPETLKPAKRIIKLAINDIM